MQLIRAILWAQWRCLRNYVPRAGVAWTAILGVLWYGVWLVASLALMRVFSEAENAGVIRTVLPGGLLAVFLYWQVVPLLMAAPGASLDLRKLRAYPIPESRLFPMEVFLRFTAAIEMSLLAGGATAGLLLNPLIPKWRVLGTSLFVIFNLFTAVGLRDLLTRVLARRGIREAAIFLFVLCMALPQVFLMRGEAQPFRILRFVGGEPWWGWPWTATAEFVHGEDLSRATWVLAAWVIAAGVFGIKQFSRTLRFDVDAAGSQPARRTQFQWVEKFYRLPSRFFSDPQGVLIEKELRFLARSPRFRIVFLMGFTFGLMIYLPILARYGTYGTESGSGGLLTRHYLTIVSVYSMMLLSEICFWNSFGFDRSATQIYFFAPVNFARVLLAKNLAAMFFIYLEIAIVTLVCAFAGMPVGVQRLVEAFLVATVSGLFLLSAGNLQSVREPRPVNPAASFRAGAAGRIQAMLFVVYPVTFAPIILAYLARYAFDSQVAFYAVLTIDAALGIYSYKLAMESAVNTAEQKRESIVAALSSGDGPIAS
jgi:ABC-2 type transport system permease protein